jgi:hypothetical protein
MPLRSLIRLTQDQRCYIDALIERGRCSPTTRTRALILLHADATAGRPRRAAEIARAAYASVTTVYRVRRRFVERGFQAALFAEGHACRLIPLAGAATRCES